MNAPIKDQGDNKYNDVAECTVFNIVPPSRPKSLLKIKILVQNLLFLPLASLTKMHSVAFFGLEFKKYNAVSAFFNTECLIIIAQDDRESY